MKKFSVLALAAVIAAPAAQALSTSEVLAIHKAVAVMEEARGLNLINWRVGDYHNFNIEMIFGKGTGTKKAEREDTARNAIWLVQEMDILGQKQKVEALISRADGKTLELIVNGQKQNPDSGGKIDIIEQNETEVTVPAGKFECVYVKAKQTATDGKVTDIELWANPVDVNLDGALKTVVKQGFIQITLLLTKFGHN